VSEPAGRETIIFLSVDDVIAIHENTMAHEGGLGGIRDLGLLESAVMTPQARFGGQYLHEGLAAMAAAYLFHIAKNHPFLDGNKRAAMASAVVFLKGNHVPYHFDGKAIERVTLAVADGSMSKDVLIEWFRSVVNG
jgi:death on curing protein